MSEPRPFFVCLRSLQTTSGSLHKTRPFGYQNLIFFSLQREPIVLENFSNLLNMRASNRLAHEDSLAAGAGAFY